MSHLNRWLGGLVVGAVLCCGWPKTLLGGSVLGGSVGRRVRRCWVGARWEEGFGFGAAGKKAAGSVLAGKKSSAALPSDGRKGFLLEN